MNVILWEEVLQEVGKVNLEASAAKYTDLVLGLMAVT
jgi:hypothetical protein